MATHHRWIALTAAAAAAAAASVVLLIVRQKRNKALPRITFVPYSFSNLPEFTLVVDSGHPTALQLTHHMKGKTQKALSLDRAQQADTSTEFVLNYLAASKTATTKELSELFRHVTANHFDIDSFLSVWCVMNPELALEHRAVLIEVARIGDFRELELKCDMQHQALQLACWLNSEEKRLFYEPFGMSIFTEDGEQGCGSKFEHFSRTFEQALLAPTTVQHRAAWREEVDQVYSDLRRISRIQSFSHIGLVAVEVEGPPTHYYALFSPSRGHDIVLAMYSDNKYEVEIKYTTMVDLASRDVLPRVEMAELAKRLDAVEPGWHADRITDSGPILRLDPPQEVEQHLSKAQRYGHPAARPIYSSCIPPDQFLRVVVSYFEFAYRGVLARKDFEWTELHEFNKAIAWEEWQCPL